MLKVAVAGGSIAGLCAGVALRKIGCNVDIYERTAGTMIGRGAGVVARSQLLRLLRDCDATELPTTSCLYRRHLLPDGGDGALTEMPLLLTSWHAIFRTLKSAFPLAHYHSGSTILAFDQTAESVTVRFAEGDSITADLLICADGSRSEMRRRLVPGAQP